MPIKLNNFALSVLVTDINSTQTTIPVASSTSFPVLGVDEYFYVTVTPPNVSVNIYNTEIMKVTKLDPFTVQRAQDGTQAKSFPTGSTVCIRGTVGNVREFLHYAANTADTTDALTNPVQIHVSGIINGAGSFDGSTDLTVHTEFSEVNATDVITNATHRFVSEASRTKWDAAVDNVVATEVQDGLLSKELASKLENFTSGTAVTLRESFTTDVGPVPVLIGDGVNTIERTVYIGVSDSGSSTNLGNGFYNAYASIGETHVIMCASTSVLVSTNAGKSWVRILIDASVSFNCVSVCNGVFLLLSATGKLYTSADGLTWVLRLTNTTKALYAATSVPGRIVVVGNAVILTSPDGISWTTLNTVTTRTLYDVSSRDGVLVAVGSSGAILKSVDSGDNWSTITSITTQTLYKVKYCTNNIIAVGGSGVICIGTIDATSWVLKNVGAAVQLNNIYQTGSGIIVAGGAIAISTDAGGTWIIKVSTVIGTINCTTVSNDTICVGNSGSVYTSPDGGLNWTYYNSGTDSNFAGAIDFNGKPLLYGSRGLLATSKDYQLFYTPNNIIRI